MIIYKVWIGVILTGFQLLEIHVEGELGHGSRNGGGIDWWAFLGDLELVFNAHVICLSGIFLSLKLYLQREK